MLILLGSTKRTCQVCRGECADCSSSAPSDHPGAASGRVWLQSAHPPLPRSVASDTPGENYIQSKYTKYKTVMDSFVKDYKVNTCSPVDTACHGFDLDCVAKAGNDILGDGARIAGNQMRWANTLKQNIYNNITTTSQSSHTWLITFSGVGNYGYGYQGYQGYDQGYVTRKELVKSGLLLGAGILKGALLTTVINNINNNNAGK